MTNDDPRLRSQAETVIGGRSPSTDPAARPEASSPGNEAGAPAPAGSRYRLGKAIGEGGMAVVYEAADAELGRTVAVKTLRPHLAGSPDLRQRFMDEARILARLDHPGAIPVYEAGRLPDGAIFYAMKKVHGTTLRALLDGRAPDGIRDRAAMLRFVDIFARVCETMASAHADGVIHRDLKPENIMVDEFGAVYVMDWGLAKRLEPEEGGDSSRTRAGAVMGTPAYMAPEQARGQALESDRRTDVFSLGVMLYEILASRNPFLGRTAGESMQGVLHHEPDDPRRINPAAGRDLCAICMKAIHKDPFRRYPSASELADDIRCFRQFLPVSAAKPRPIDRLVRWSRRRPRVATAAATLALVALLAGTALAWQAAVEGRLVRNAHAVLDERQAEIRRIQVEIDEVKQRVRRSPEAGEERRSLESRLASLEAEQELARGILRGMAWATIGFTVLSPDARAQQVAREEVLESIRSALGAGDTVRARLRIRFAIRTHERRQGWFGFSPDEDRWLRSKLAEVEAKIGE